MGIIVRWFYSALMNPYTIIDGKVLQGRCSFTARKATRNFVTEFKNAASLPDT